jgi:hypothetical protein
MRLGGRVLVFVALCVLGGVALAQELDFKAIPLPSDKDDIAAAKLPSAEVKQILEQVEQTSFDTPDQSWIPDLIATAHLSASTSTYRVYVFDGTLSRRYVLRGRGERRETIGEANSVQVSR